MKNICATNFINKPFALLYRKSIFKIEADFNPLFSGIFSRVFYPERQLSLMFSVFPLNIIHFLSTSTLISLKSPKTFPISIMVRLCGV
jgi:hypothetical protein